MNRQLARMFALFALGLVMVFAVACDNRTPQPSVAPTPTAPAVTTGQSSGGPPDELVAAAKQEGSLTVIALPHDWCGYGAVIEGFKSRFGLKVNEVNPDAGSGDEIAAVKASRDKQGPDSPDVIDVGLSFAPQARTDGLIRPYKVSTWLTIPNDAKDPEGYWYGDYYGVLAFEINTDIVKRPPQDWKDLLRSDYKGQVALAGDPRVSSQAIMGVYAAGIATGGSPDNAATPGLKFFADVNNAGNLVPVIGRGETVANGQTPILIRWDYNALADKDTHKGKANITVVVPKSGVVGGFYVQAISTYAPHPNAAKLWMEYIYSDEGQLAWLKGYCHPIRYNDLARKNKIPAELAANLPPVEAYATAVFPTYDQQQVSGDNVKKNWDTVVGVNIK